MDTAAVAAYCAVPQTDCRGWCPNDGIPDKVGGVPARVSTYIIVTVSGLSIIMIKNASDKRLLYWYQYTIFLIHLISAIIFGGLLHTKTLSAYHALLITYFSFGANLTIAIAFFTTLFSRHFLDYIFFLLSNLAFNITCTLLLTKLTVAKSSSATFGSQASCNSLLNHAPWHSSKIPAHVFFLVLVVMPWVIGYIYTIVRKWKSNPRSSATPGSTNPSEPSTRQKLILFASFATLYGVWITAAEFYVKSQAIPMLGGPTKEFKLSQIPMLTLAIICVLFPIRAIIQHVRGEGSHQHARVPTHDLENPNHDNDDYTATQSYNSTQRHSPSTNRRANRNDERPHELGQPAGVVSVFREPNAPKSPRPPAYGSINTLHESVGGETDKSVQLEDLRSVASSSTLRASVLDGSKTGIDAYGTWSR